MTHVVCRPLQVKWLSAEVDLPYKRAAESMLTEESFKLDIADDVLDISSRYEMVIRSQNDQSLHELSKDTYSFGDTTSDLTYHPRGSVGSSVGRVGRSLLPCQNALQNLQTANLTANE